MENKKNETLMHGFSEGKTSLFTKKVLGILVAVALVGFGSGYLLARTGGEGGANPLTKMVNKANIPAGEIVGSDDTETFKDTAEGELAEGGVDGEGQYHLVRPGGESQYVYLISSNVDMSQLVGRKIKVWGQTQKAEKVGWLMDVGRVQVLQ